MFTPIVSADQLPQVGVACEKTTLDFKKELTADAFEAAKDVAAFANAAGGTLLIGAQAQGEVVAKYFPMTSDKASAAQRFYEQSVRDRCRPGPLTRIEHLPHEGGVVLAINVQPSLGQPVGVEFKKTGNAQGDWPQGVYLYPVRVGSHTRPILPEQMTMFVDAKFRRNVLALRGAEGQRIVLFGFTQSGNWLDSFQIVEVNEVDNSVNLQCEDDGKKVDVSLPIDKLQSVWRDGHGLKAGIHGYLEYIDWAHGVDGTLSIHKMVFLEIAPPRGSYGGRRRSKLAPIALPTLTTATPWAARRGRPPRARAARRSRCARRSPASGRRSRAGARRCWRSTGPAGRAPCGASARRARRRRRQGRPWPGTWRP